MPPPANDPAFAHPQSIDLLCLYPPFNIRLYFSQSDQWLTYSDALYIWRRYNKHKPTADGAASPRASGRDRKPQRARRRKTRENVGRVVPKRPRHPGADTA